MIRLFSVTGLICLSAASLTLIGQSGPSAGPMQLAWVNREGKTISKIAQPQWFITDPMISPDGTKVAAGGRDLQNEVDHLWIYDLVNGTKRRLTNENAQERHSTWSPKGDKIVFYSMRNNNQADLYVRNTDGSGEEPLVLSDDRHEYYPTWSADGLYVAYHTLDRKTNSRDIYYVEITGDRKPKPFTAGPAEKALARFSPDARYIAYGSDESGKWEVYVKPFPKGDARWKISTNGGVWPRWSDKGELFFWEGNTLMAVKVVAGTTFKAGTPQKLFTGAQAGMGSSEMKDFSPTYDVARNGNRFLVVQIPH
jgi:Tol biopolymer transport system component